MTGEVDVLLGKCSQLRHLLLKAGIVQAVYGNEQHILTGAHIAIVQIAERVLYGDRFRIALLYQTALIFLRIQQTVFFKKTSRRHRIRERQVCPLHGNRPVKISVCPDVDKMRCDKGDEKECRKRPCEMATARETAQFLPTPCRK